MITRRDTLLALAAAAAGVPVLCAAQASGRIARIGVLANASAQARLPRPIEALRDALAELGYVDGRTAKIEYRWSGRKVELLPALARELVNVPVDVIVASGDEPARAAKAATGSIPIVMATSQDAVGTGLVASLARPGGNVTGMTAMSPELGAKRLELLRELVPGCDRVAIVRNPAESAHMLEWRQTGSAAAQFGIALEAIDLRGGNANPESAHAAIRQSKAMAIIVFNDSTTVAVRPRLLLSIAERRLPAMYEAAEWADAGGLLAYGVAHVDLFRRAAAFVDRILKGAKPQDLPVEQPTVIRLVINLGTASTLGLRVPQSLLLRADRVIE